MYVVYILRSQSMPNKHYVGFTTDLKKRLTAHNAKKSSYSRKYAPWEIHTYLVFTSENKARDFERYLKKGSGWAFLKKRLI
ncbi:MAG: GIY-YIG nuclease family protein [Candidatus Omnitrophota bacterium]